MTTLTALARAEAVDRGRAQPICTVRHMHVSDHPLVLVPLALAGEASAPLAAMVGDSATSPQLLVVAQPRNRDQRFAFAAALAGVVMRYISSYLRAKPASDAPQILVPNAAGIGFLRLLGRSTRFRVPHGEYAVAPAVPLLGRWLTFLAERAEHPGSCLLLAATQALALHWASGQSPVEDQNLAALLGWIEPPAGMTGPEAALAAEDPLTWPPAGPATDPTFDNELLAPLIGACARAGDDPAARRRAESALEAALAGQLTPTWELMWRAAGILRALAPGEQVAVRWEADVRAFGEYDEYLREGGPPQPRRDSAVAAARRLDWLERALARYSAQRALDDPLVMAEYRMTGEAFAGTVTASEPDRIDATGRRRKLRPWITVSTEDKPRIEAGNSLRSAARPGQSALVVSVATPAGATADVVLELSGGMGRSLTPAPGSVPDVGDRVCYAKLADSWQPSGAFPAREDTPWTHGGPPPEYVPADDDANETWS